MKAVTAALSGICFLLTISTVQAWNKPGHMISAAVAYADLIERNPDVAGRVVEILKQHPYFKTKWEDKLNRVDPNDRDLLLFMLAAAWPDEVRGNRRYDHPERHYVNIPYRPGENRRRIPKNKGILKAFPEIQPTIKSSLMNPSDRAIALCWMFHLIGDVHQPLHTIKLVTKQFPEPNGDRGGTRFYIRVTPAGRTISLHRFWDGLILGSDRFQTVKNEAAKLRNMSGLRRTDLSEPLTVQAFDDWALASYDIAVKYAYRNGALEGSSSKDNGTVLPEGYKVEAKKTAERQIVLSAYRISDFMIVAFGTKDVPAP